MTPEEREKAIDRIATWMRDRADTAIALARSRQYTIEQCQKQSGVTFEDLKDLLDNELPKE